MHAHAPDLLPLIGVAVLVGGFAVRLNPLAVVAAAAFASGLAAGLSPLQVLSAFGKAFNDNRYVSLIWLVVPVVGVLERAGLRDRAREAVARFRGSGGEPLSVGQLLLSYFIVRQITAALGLTALGGQAQMVRPLIAPMAEAAGDSTTGPLLTRDQRDLVRAHAAAADNVAVFFGEDIFIAFGSVLLIRGVLAGGGHEVSPLSISLWALPTAGLALLIHGARLLGLDRRLKRGRP
jgi:uncharacterized membrane protein